MKRTILFCSIAALLLFCIAFFFVSELFDFLFSLLPEKVVVQGDTLSGPFMSAIWLCISIALAPLFLMTAWLAGNIYNYKNRILSIFIVMVFIAITITTDMLRIKNSTPAAFNGYDFKIVLQFKDIYFEYSIIAGILLGCITSYFLFKKPKQKIS